MCMTPAPPLGLCCFVTPLQSYFVQAHLIMLALEKQPAMCFAKHLHINKQLTAILVNLIQQAIKRIAHISQVGFIPVM